MSACWIWLAVIGLGGFGAGLAAAQSRDAQTPNLALDIVVYPDHAGVWVRVPIATLVENDARASGAATATTSPAALSDEQALKVCTDHTDQITRGVHVFYDNAPLTPKLMAARMQMMPPPGGGADVQTAEYIWEYHSADGAPQPKLVTMNYRILKDPANGPPLTSTAELRFHSWNVMGFRSTRLVSGETWSNDPRLPPPSTETAATPAAAPAVTPAAPEPVVLTSSDDMEDPNSPEANQRRMIRYALLGGAGVLIVIALGIKLARRNAPPPAGQ